MKIKLILLISAFLLPDKLFAQAAREKTSAIFIIKSHSSTNEVVTHNLIMPFSSAKAFDLMSSQDAEKRFRNSKNMVAFVVTLNPNVKLVSLEDFFKRRKVKNGGQKGLIVDGQLLTNTSDALIEESAVTSIDFKSDTVKIETLSKDRLHGFKPPLN